MVVMVSREVVVAPKGTITNGPEGGYDDDDPMSEPWEFKRPCQVDVREPGEEDEGVGESLVKDCYDHTSKGDNEIVDKSTHDVLNEMAEMLPAQVEAEYLTAEEAGRTAVVRTDGQGGVVTDPASADQHPDDVLLIQRQAAAFKRLLREELKRQGVTAESLAKMVAEGLLAEDARTGYPNHRMRMKYAEMALRILGTAPAVNLKATSYNFPGHSTPGAPSWGQISTPGETAQRALAGLPPVDLSNPDALAEVQQALERAKSVKKRLEKAAEDAKAAAAVTAAEVGAAAPKEPEE